MTRKPVVAGKFYPQTKEEIVALINLVTGQEKPNINYNLSKKNIIGGILPHAGYIFSAYQAIHFFEIIKNSKTRYDTVVILHPNHYGHGADLAFDSNDLWETPLGKLEIDKDFYYHLPFTESATAHQYEHSAEVMLPFLQHSLNYYYKILPISISKQNLNSSQNIAKSIFNAAKALNKKILIIASSDFSHYVEPEEGKKLDQYVIDEILKLNANGVFQTIIKKNVSVCGYCPIMSLIEYSKLVDKETKVEILKRGHSGEIIPSSEVVDYVSMLFYN